VRLALLYHGGAAVDCWWQLAASWQSMPRGISSSATNVLNAVHWELVLTSHVFLAMTSAACCHVRIQLVAVFMLVATTLASLMYAGLRWLHRSGRRPCHHRRHYCPADAAGQGVNCRTGGFDRVVPAHGPTVCLRSRVPFFLPRICVSVTCSEFVPARVGGLCAYTSRAERRAPFCLPPGPFSFLPHIRKFCLDGVDDCNAANDIPRGVPGLSSVRLPPACGCSQPRPRDRSSASLECCARAIRI